ncbi:MAG: hypothetical protein IPO40_10035 [Fibrobacteres bacterium]|nr:hypothetical protein [Fibrobacterota bacterium]
MTLASVLLTFVSMASAQGPNVPDLFRPDPKLTFLETRGQLLPSEAKHVALRVEAIDTFELRVRPVTPEDAASRNDFYAKPMVSWPTRIRLIRPRDSLTTWTAWLDLHRLAKQYPGSFLEVMASAGPRAYRPTTKEVNCDSVWTKGRFLVTTLGLVGTSVDNKGILLQAVDLETMTPWSGVEIRSFDDHVLKGVTDSLGQLWMGKLHPSRWIASSPGNAAQLAVFDPDFAGLSNHRVLQLGADSRVTSSLEEGIRLYPYQLRSFHRPGDTLVLGCIVRGPGGQIPSGKRIKMAITDPWSHRIDSVWQSVDPKGHLQWRWPIAKKASTGSYKADFSLGKSQQTIHFKVEETRIPRLLLDAWLAKSESDSFPKRLEVRSRWNTSRPTSRLPLQIRWVFRGTAFGQGTTRLFGISPWKSSEVCDTSLNGSLDNEGSASLAIPFPPADRCGYAGTLTAVVSVLEEGGHTTDRTVHSQFLPWHEGPGLEVSTSDTVAKVSTTWLDGNGKHGIGRPLDLRLVWGPETLLTIRKASGDTWELPISVLKDRFTDTSLIYRLSLSACAAGTSVCVGSPLSASVQYTGRFAWVPDWAWFNSSPAAKRPDSLVFHPELSPRRLEEGDSLEIRWESATGGLAWIHAVQGSRILRRELRLQRPGTNRWKTPTDSTWFPGVDVAILRLQRHGSDPATWVEADSRHFELFRKPHFFRIQIMSDSVFHPRSKAHVTIVNPAHRQGLFVFSAIDQGILDLAPVSMPDPKKVFESPESSELEWWDAMGWRRRLYALDAKANCSTEPSLFESYGSSARQGRMALGAGGNGNGVSTRGKASLMMPPRALAEPLAWISKPTPLPIDRMDLSFPIPAFLGQVRLCVVASSGRDVFVGDTAIHSRAPIEGTLSTPQFLSPGDTTMALVRSWSVSRDTGRLRIQTWGTLASLDSSRSVRFDSAGAFTARTALVAGNTPGSTWVEAVVRQGKDSIGIPNRLEIKDDRNWSSRFQSRTSRDGMASLAIDQGFSDSLQQCRVEVSTGGFLGLDRRMNELLAYPHGCLEQTISKAMPQLFLDRLFPSLDKSSRQKASSHVDNALAHLHRFANPSGMLSLWSGTGEDHAFASLWAARFLLEAKQRGHVVPTDLQSRLNDALRRVRLSKPIEEAWRIAFLSRSSEGASKPRSLSDSLALDSLSRLNLSREARWIVASAWKLRGDDSLARHSVLRAWSAPDSLSPRSRHQMGSLLRDRAWALDAMASLSGNRSADSLMDLIGRDLESARWLSTHEEGSIFLGLAHATNVESPRNPLSLQWRFDDGKWHSVALDGGRASWTLPKRGDTLRLRSAHPNATFRAQLHQAGVRSSSEVQRDSGFTVQSKIVRHDSESVGSPLREGHSFEWEIRIHNTSGQNLTDIGATAWLPGGWTIRPELTSGRKVGFKFVEVRADRVVHHLDLADGKEAILRIPMRALQEGSYRGPEVSVETLYDGALRARWKGDRARVVR